MVNTVWLINKGVGKNSLDQIPLKQEYGLYL